MKECVDNCFRIAQIIKKKQDTAFSPPYKPSSVTSFLGQDRRISLHYQRCLQYFSQLLHYLLLRTGTFAVISLMLGSALEKFLSTNPFVPPNSTVDASVTMSEVTAYASTAATENVLGRCCVSSELQLFCCRNRLLTVNEISQRWRAVADTAPDFKTSLPKFAKFSSQ